MAAEYVLVCDSADFDTATRTCSAAHYELAPTGWPALSLAEAQTLGEPIVWVFALAWCWRRLRKVAV